MAGLVAAIINERTQFVSIRQAPVGMSSQTEILADGQGILPIVGVRADPVLGIHCRLLPLQTGDSISHRTVIVVDKSVLGWVCPPRTART